MDMNSTFGNQNSYCQNAFLCDGTIKEVDIHRVAFRFKNHTVRFFPGYGDVIAFVAKLCVTKVHCIYPQW